MASTQTLAQQTNYKWWVFGAMSFGLFVSVMDQSGLSIAIPQIAGSFKAGIPTVQWVMLAYILTISALMLPMGRLSDIVGRKRIYTIGMLVFAAGAALAGFAPTLGAVISMKVLQGVGSAMTQATGMAIVISAFPAKERGKAIGLTTTMVGIGAVAGPVMGGAVVQALGWRAIMLVAAPLGVASALAALMVLAREAGDGKGNLGSLRSFDYMGAALFTTSLMGFLFIMSFGYRLGWTSLVVLLGGVGVVGVMALFVVVERKAPQPLLHLELLQRPAFSMGATSNVLSFMATTAVFFLMPFYLQEVRGYSPSESGLIMVVAAVCMAVIGPLAGRFSDRFGFWRFTSLGAGMATLSSLLFSRLTATSPMALVYVALALAGTGMATFQAPNSSAMLASVERERYGLATAFLNLSRNVGNITGTALATTIVTASMAAQGFAPSLAAVKDSSGDAVRLAFAQGMGHAFLLATALNGVALALCLARRKA